ncbi:hypothetical protein M5K25_027107 [Dendrobium thyrsiflorum]|uniref:Uncharacterized protein n=1 Tax=Dendrobium thyrsiflorum TaxID=117978 RepID=A0ABD0TZ39_DENTH
MGKNHEAWPSLNESTSASKLGSDPDSTATPPYSQVPFSPETRPILLPASVSSSRRRLTSQPRTRLVVVIQPSRPSPAIPTTAAFQRLTAAHSLKLVQLRLHNLWSVTRSDHLPSLDFTPSIK